MTPMTRKKILAVNTRSREKWWIAWSCSTKLPNAEESREGQPAWPSCQLWPWRRGQHELRQDQRPKAEAENTLSLGVWSGMPNMLAHAGRKHKALFLGRRPKPPAVAALYGRSRRDAVTRWNGKPAYAMLAESRSSLLCGIPPAEAGGSRRSVGAWHKARHARVWNWSLAELGMDHSFTSAYTPLSRGQGSSAQHHRCCTSLLQIPVAAPGARRHLKSKEQRPDGPPHGTLCGSGAVLTRAKTPAQRQNQR